MLGQPTLADLYSAQFVAEQSAIRPTRVEQYELANRTGISLSPSLHRAQATSPVMHNPSFERLVAMFKGYKA